LDLLTSHPRPLVSPSHPPSSGGSLRLRPPVEEFSAEVRFVLELASLFMSHLTYVIATVLFIWAIWIKNLENLIFFFPKYTFTREIGNILCLYEYFSLYTVPQIFRSITGISPTAHSCSDQMVFCFFHSRFSTAAFLRSTAHSSFSKNYSPTKHNFGPIAFPCSRSKLTEVACPSR
jgi:hypothetical protein